MPTAVGALVWVKREAAGWSHGSACSVLRDPNLQGVRKLEELWLCQKSPGHALQGLCCRPAALNLPESQGPVHQDSGGMRSRQ
ncbi:unnamed protein product [Rangifer tarandus platyrhynchus]|uniref:Uncharacterized protein n=1 Tax=Rangifer tarandus platyrhynchus TaxID=3082113 RepID=A0AC59Z6H4_RANTA